MGPFSRFCKFYGSAIAGTVTSTLKSSKHLKSLTSEILNHTMLANIADLGRTSERKNNHSHKCIRSLISQSRPHISQHPPSNPTRQHPSVVIVKFSTKNISAAMRDPQLPTHFYCIFFCYKPLPKIWTYSSAFVLNLCLFICFVNSIFIFLEFGFCILKFSIRRYIKVCIITSSLITFITYRHCHKFY